MNLAALPSFDKQFRPRLGERAGLGQNAAGAGALSRRGRPDARQIRRGLRAVHRERASDGASASADPSNGGDPRPAGQGGRAERCRRSASRESSTSAFGGWSSFEAEGPGPARGALRESSPPIPDRGLRDPDPVNASGREYVRHPGREAEEMPFYEVGCSPISCSCDERDALLACTLAAVRRG